VHQSPVAWFEELCLPRRRARARNPLRGQSRRRPSFGRL